MVLRWVVVAALALVFQGAVMYSGIRVDTLPVSPDLETVPREMSGWTQRGSSQLDGAVLDYLRPDSSIERLYASPSGAAAVTLFLAYFKSLKTGYGPHSPAVCLPGAGWLTRQSSEVELTHAGLTVPINEHWMVKGNQQILVWYWYQNRRHMWAREEFAKLYLLPDIIRYRRSDVALVRLIATVNQDNATAARGALREFAQAALPEIQSRMPE